MNTAGQGSPGDPYGWQYPTNTLPVPRQSGRLKPCPFCGAIPKVIERVGMRYPWAIDHGAGRLDYQCPLDYLVLTDYSSEDRAINHWNRRWPE